MTKPRQNSKYSIVKTLLLAACLLASTKLTAENSRPETLPVRVLFYGQSIVAGGWTRYFEATLKDRYPELTFTFRNAAIGGYTSQFLVRTAEHDLYPWYPDLLFLHVYGPIEFFEEIVQETRKRTTAQIILWSSHFRAVDDPVRQDRDDDIRAKAIRALADRHDALFIDLREVWRHHLLENNLQPDVLLSDGIHLNDTGNKLYAQFIADGVLDHIPVLIQKPWSTGSIRRLTSEDPSIQTLPSGELEITFTGNRLIGLHAQTSDTVHAFNTWLNDEPIEEHPSQWAHTRPSRGPAGIWMPAINRITLESLPLAETWTLVTLPDSAADGGRIHFRLRGELTGEDGEGWSHETFRSISGRVVISPQDWHIAPALRHRKAELPEGFEVTWNTYPLFTSPLLPKAPGEHSVLMQGGPPDTHRVRLQGHENPSKLFSAFILYNPVPETP